MDIGWVRVVHMIYSNLYEDLLMRVKCEQFKLNSFTLIFCPGRVILELMSNFLQRKTYKIEKKNEKSKLCITLVPGVYLFIYFLNLIQYLSRGIKFSRASLNGALTQHKTKT